MSPKFHHISLYQAPARMGIFVLILLFIWLPMATPIYLLFGSDPNLVTILTMGLLFLIFIFLVFFWGKYVYHQPNLFKIYGLKWTKFNRIAFIRGLSLGLILTFALFICEGMLGLLQFQPPSMPLFTLIFEGFLSGLGIGLAEELLFRGWLLDELERDYSKRKSLWFNAVIFALLHFIKPIDEIKRTFVGFPGLILLGLTLVWAKRRYGNNLGISIGIHSGLVWGYYVINVGELVEYSGKVPPWITGIDGNPTAGLMGLMFLGILALWMRRNPKNISHLK